METLIQVCILQIYMLELLQLNNPSLWILAAVQQHFLAINVKIVESTRMLHIMLVKAQQQKRLNVNYNMETRNVLDVTEIDVYFQQVMLKGHQYQDNSCQIRCFLGINSMKITQNVDFVIEQQIPSIFGCTLSETNQFYSQYPDGIMGLSPKTNTSQSFPSIVDDIYSKEQSVDLQNVFTICIGRINGYMVVGGYDVSRHQPNSAYYKVPYNDVGDMYNVKINKIIFNGVYTILQGNEINFSNGVGIDSGSTLFHADYKIVNKLRQYFNMTNETKYLELNGLPCYQYDSSRYDFKTFASLFPEYYFEFDKFNFTWSPIDYLTKDFDENDYYCLPVASYSGRNSIILGQAWMRNWDIAFNKSDSTIRFVKNTCSDRKVHHDYTGEEIIKLEQGLNYTNKTRSQPKQQEQTFFDKYQLVIKIGGMLIIILIVFIVYMIFRKRRMSKMSKKQRLDIEDLEIVQATKG